MKNWVSKSSGVESKGVPGMLGSTWSAAATVWLESIYVRAGSVIMIRTIYSRGEKSDNLSGGESSGVRETGEDAVDSVERLRNGQIGRGLGGIGAAEEHCETGGTGAVGHTNGTGKLDATRKGERLAPWFAYGARQSHKSAVVMLLRWMRGRCSSMISSTPLFAWKLVSMSSKRAIDPSAPPPLQTRQQRVWSSKMQ